MSSLPPQFTELIKKWIQLDNQIQQMNNQVKVLRDQRDSIQEKVIPYMRKNQLDKTAIRFNNDKVYIGNENNYTNLSYKFLEEKLLDLFKDQKKVDQICQHLKNSRSKQSSLVLKHSIVKK